MQPTPRPTVRGARRRPSGRARPALPHSDSIGFDPPWISLRCREYATPSVRTMKYRLQTGLHRYSRGRRIALPSPLRDKRQNNQAVHHWRRGPSTSQHLSQCDRLAAWLVGKIFLSTVPGLGHQPYRALDRFDVVQATSLAPENERGTAAQGRDDVGSDDKTSVEVEGVTVMIGQRDAQLGPDYVLASGSIKYRFLIKIHFRHPILLFSTTRQ
jgi:hypothetical protein